MASAYGVKFNDWILVGILAAVGYYAYKKLNKPIENAADTVGNVTGFASNATSGFPGYGTSFADWTSDYFRNTQSLINPQTPLGDNARTMTVTNPDQSTTTYKGNAAQLFFGYTADQLNNLLPAEKNRLQAQNPRLFDQATMSLVNRTIAARTAGQVPYRQFEAQNNRISNFSSEAQQFASNLSPLRQAYTNDQFNLLFNPLYRGQ